MELVCAGCLKRYNLMGAPGKQFRCRCGNKLTIPKAPVNDQFGVVQCSGCWTRYSVAGRKSGAKFKCRNCGNIVTIRNTGNTAPEPPVGGEFDEAQTQVISLEDIRKKEAVVKPTRPASGRSRKQVGRPASEARGRSAARPRPASSAGVRPRQRVEGVGAGSTAASGAENASLRQEIASLRQQAAGLNRKVEEVSRSRDKLEGSLEEKEALLGAKDGEIKALNERLARMEQDKAAVDGQLREAGQGIAKLKKQAASLQGAIEERDEQIGTLQAEIEGLKGKIDELTDELANRVTREETIKFREEKAKTEKMVADVSTEVAGTREALRNILEKATALSGEIASLQDDAGKFDQLPDVLKKLDDERASAKKHAGENEKLRGELAEARRRLNEVRKSLEEAAERERRMLEDGEQPGGLLQRGAAKILGLFGGRSSDVATGETIKASPPPAHGAQALPVEKGDMVQPDEVADLGDELPAPEPIPVDGEEVLAADPDNDIPPIEAAQRAALAEGPPGLKDEVVPEGEPAGVGAEEDVWGEEAEEGLVSSKKKAQRKRRSRRLERYK